VESTHVVVTAIKSLVVQLPVLLVCLGAGVVAVVKWRRAPRPALCAAAGFALLGLQAFAHAVTSPVLHRILWECGVDRSARDVVTVCVGLALTTVKAAALVLLLAAVFIGRSRPVPTTPT